MKTHTTVTAGRATDARSTTGPALAALSLSMLMPSLDTSIANAGLPELAQAFDASFSAVQWIVLAYLLAITALIVSAGRLGDLLGRRRLLLGGITLFTIASLLCGLAPTLWFLVAARALQGMGAAIMMSQSVAMVSETVPKSRTGSAMGLLGTMSAIGTTLGPSLGGVLIASLGWRSIFLINVPAGIANVLLAFRYLPPDVRETRDDRRRFDVAGTLLLAVTLGGYALSMTVGRDLGTYAALLVVATVSGAAAFLFVQYTSTSPLVDVHLFRDAGLRTGLIRTALVSTVMMSTLVVGPFHLARGLGLDALSVGFALSVGPLFAAIAGVPAGHLTDRFGSSRMTLSGLTAIAIACGALSLVPARFGVAGYLVPIVVMTSGYALFQAANNTSIMQDVESGRRGAISGMLTLSRNLGLITGASVMGGVFALAAGGDVTTAAPSAVAQGARITFAVAAIVIVAAIAAGRWRLARISRSSPPGVPSSDGGHNRLTNAG